MPLEVRGGFPWSISRLPCEAMLMASGLESPTHSQGFLRKLCSTIEGDLANMMLDLQVRKSLTLVYLVAS